VLSLLAPCVAHAAPGVALPGNADPGRIIENLQPVPEPPAPAAPEITISPATTGQPPAGAEKAIFLINYVVIEGTTAYDAVSLEALFRPYYGKRISLKKLYELADDITRRYHDDGYELSRAVLPPQKIKGGTVRIQVVEGYIDSVKTEGTYRDAPAARGIIERLRDDRPLNMHHLERDLLLLSDLAGVSVRAVLKPHANDPGGTSGLTLVFADQPVPSTASIDNYGSRYTGPVELSASSGVNHLPLAYDQFLVNGMIDVPFNELQYVQASERVPLSSWGTTATLQGIYAHSEPGFRLTPEQIESHSWNYGVSVSQPLIRSRLQNLTVGGDFTVKDIATDALGSELYHDKLRIVSLNASYDRQDGWGGSNLLQAKLSQGLDILGATGTGSPDLSRADGHSDFTRISGNAGRLQAITDTVHLYLAAEGQYAWSPLLSSEQFGFGGQQFGRAYDASELTGDDGMAASAELRYSPPTPLPNLHPELFAFYDIGRVWNYGDWGGGVSAASAGLGARFAFGNHLSGSLEVAQPLTHRVAAPEWGNGKDPRVFASLTARF
jgi:hemolysin activation/secretion protein